MHAGVCHPRILCTTLGNTRFPAIFQADAGAPLYWLGPVSYGHALQQEKVPQMPHARHGTRRAD
jgi:hypothetical protein